jgi:hypothetical protein
MPLLATDSDNGVAAGAQAASAKAADTTMMTIFLDMVSLL